MNVLSKTRGFTLVEVLVGMVIFSLLMLLVSFSFSQSMQLWQRQKGTFSDALSHHKQYLHIVNAIESAVPIKREQTVPSALVGDLKNTLYFSGEEKKLSLFVASGVFFDEPTHLTLSCVQQSDGQFYQLVVSEDASFSQLANSVVWLNELEYCEFDYYGTPIDTRSVDLRFTPLSKTWFTNFHGKHFGYFPNIVRLKWKHYDSTKESLENTMMVNLAINADIRFDLLENSLE